MIIILQLVLPLSLKLPIRFIDKHQDTWSAAMKSDCAFYISWLYSHTAVQHEHVFPGILHDVVAKMLDQKCYI